MSVDLIKNNRFKVLSTGTLLFNPFLTVDNINIAVVGTSPSEFPSSSIMFHDVKIGTTFWYNATVNSWDLISFNGQVVGFAYQYLRDGTIPTTAILFPSGTFDYQTSADVSSMMNTYGSIDCFRAVYDSECSEPQGVALTILDSIPVFTTDIYTSLNVNTNIKECLISNYKIVKNAALYGQHNRIYKSKNTYTGTIQIPPSTSINKINQMLQSKSVIFLSDNRGIYIDTLIPYGETIEKPLGGGSIDPVARVVTITSADVTAIYRRGYFYIDVVFEG